jgi:hypothetical protein
MCFSVCITPLVAAEAGVQTKPIDWISAFAGMSGDFGNV